MSHCKGILKYLKKNKKGITALEALYVFGTMRLGARIFDLKEEGYNIDKTMVSEDGKRFARYFLTK